MSKFEIPYLADIFSTLGTQLSCPDDELSAIIRDEHHYNAWFTADSVEKAVKAIGRMLNKKDLSTWLNGYPTDRLAANKQVGLVLAGNIPMVGFHDVLCVLISGNHALIKSSSQDNRLIKEVLERLPLIEPAFGDT